MDRQKLQDFALIAEVVAAAAVIVTLVFLVLEMRSNTDAIRAQTYTELMTQINDWRALTVTDPTLAELTDKKDAEGWEGLSSVEERRVWFGSIVLWGIYESAFYARERGVLGEDEWQRFEITMCRRFRSGVDWDPPGRREMPLVLTPRFVQYVESVCG